MDPARLQAIVVVQLLPGKDEPLLVHGDPGF